MKIEICAGTLTLNSARQILLIKPSNRNAWAIPKGHVESNENYADAAARETFEETGVRVNILSELSDFEVETKFRRKIVKMFLAVAADDAVPIADGFENSDAKFFDVDSLPKLVQSQSKWSEENLNKICRFFI